MITQEDFFQILDFLRDNEDVGELSPEIRQLALNSKIQAETFFSKVLDCAAYNSDDYNRLRGLIIDWYASLKTFQDLGKGTTDAFSLPGTLLNYSLQNFGMKYGSGIQDITDKALFLYNLCELYKIKGTPQSLKSAIEFFGLYDIQIYEWWLYHDEVLDKLFIKSSYVDLGGIVPETVPVRVVPYEYVLLDGHWWYQEQNVIDIHKGGSTPLRLPSITPFFSVTATAKLSTLFSTYSIISREISDQWYYFLDEGTIEPERSIYFDYFGGSISVLELILSISHIYNNWTSRTQGSDDLYYVHYSGDETEYDIIIDEYNELIKRPSSRDDQSYKLSQYYQKFTALQADSFIKGIEDVENKLQQINPDLKTWLDERISLSDHEETLDQALQELDGFLKLEIGLQAVSFLNWSLGRERDDIEKVINVFKPEKARLFEFNLLYAIDNPLEFSINLDSDLLWAIANYNIDNQVRQSLNSSLFTRIYHYMAPHMVPTLRSTYDCGLYYDIYAITGGDSLFTRIKQWNSLTYNTLSDSDIIRPIVYISEDAIYYHNYDRGVFYDSPGVSLVYDRLLSIQEVLYFDLDYANTWGYRYYDRGLMYDKFDMEDEDKVIITDKEYPQETYLAYDSTTTLPRVITHYSEDRYLRYYDGGGTFDIVTALLDNIEIIPRAFPRDSLVVEYMMETDSTAQITLTDTSNNSHDGTIYGAEFESGYLGKSLSFNGTSDYVSIPSGIFPQNDFTIAYMYKFNTWASYSSPTEKYSNPWSGQADIDIFGGDYYLNSSSLYGHAISGFDSTTGQIDVYIDSDSTSLNDNEWHCYIATFSSSEGKKLFIDGIEVSSSGDLGDIDTYSGESCLGRAYIDGAWAYFNGNISRFRVWNRVLNRGEIDEVNAEIIEERYDISDTELIQNGDFDNDSTSWIEINSPDSTCIVDAWIGNCIRIEQDSTNYPALCQGIETTSGQLYLATCYHKDGNVGGIFRIGSSSSDVNGELYDSNTITDDESNEWNKHFAIFEGDGSTVYVKIIADSTATGEYTYFDKVSVREISLK